MELVNFGSRKGLELIWPNGLVKWVNNYTKLKCKISFELSYIKIGVLIEYIKNLKILIFLYTREVEFVCVP